MGWILCGGPPLGPSNLKYSGTELRKKSSQDTREDSSTLGPFDLDADDDGSDGDDCDLEWDLWATDLTRQALVNVSNNNADAGTEPLSTHHHRIRPTASSSTFSSATLSEQALPTSPISHRPGDIVPGANMGLLSVDSPALLTAPSVLPLQSTVSVGGGRVVRTRSLLSIDGGRGRGVARAMEIVAEDGGEALSPSSKHRAGRRKRAGEENKQSSYRPQRLRSRRHAQCRPHKRERDHVDDGQGARIEHAVVHAVPRFSVWGGVVPRSDRRLRWQRRRRRRRRRRRLYRERAYRRTIRR